MSRNENLQKIGVLQGARNPDFRYQAEVLRDNADGKQRPQDLDASGLGASNVIYAYIGTRLRERAKWRSADITVTTVAAETYDVTVNGTTASYTASGSDGESDIIDGLRNAVDSNLRPPVDAEAEDLDDDGNSDNLHIHGYDNNDPIAQADDYSISVSASGSAGLDLDVDATSVEWRLWRRLKNRDTWDVMPGYENVRQDDNGLRLVRVSGANRLYVQVLSCDGRCLPTIAPCVLDSND